MHPIGIDLGTTYSAISKWVSRTNFTGGETYNIAQESGYTLPSKVFLDEEDGTSYFIVGSQAMRDGIRRPEQLVTAVKRKMDNASFRYKLLGRSYSPIDVSAEIIKKLLKVAESIEAPETYVPEGIVVTVPHYFKQHQNVNTYQAALKAIKDLYAGRKTNGPLEDLMLGVLAEPIAAGLDYAFQRDAADGEENILIFDLGGGTFDVTIFSLRQQGSSIRFKVLAVDGNDRLGGEDFDTSLFEWMCQEEGLDLSALDDKTRRNALKKILPEVTKAKEDLAAAKRTELLIAHAIGAEHIEMEVKRADFEACITGKAGDMKDYYSVVEAKLQGVLTKSGLSESDITWVLLVGGSSRISLFKKLIEDNFGLDKCKDSGNVRLAVTRGAAIYAAYLLDEKLEQAGKPRKHLALWDHIEIEEVTAHQLGIELNGRFKMFLKDGEPTPRSRTKIFEPTTLSANGQRAKLDCIRIAQGNRNDYAIVGEVELDDIYTHGRKIDDISIPITFTAHRNLVTVKVLVKQGNADGSDYVKEGQLTFKQSAENGADDS